MISKLVRLWKRLLFNFRRNKFERELQEEMNFHLEKKIEANEANGMSSEEARYSAKREFGNQTLLQERSRHQWAFVSLDALYQDIRFGIRFLRKSPVFAAVAIFTLALGIGANTAIFSVVEGVVLAPLPYNRPEQLVIAWQNYPQRKQQVSLSYLDFQDWKRDARAFQKISAYRWQNRDLSNPGAPEHLSGKEITTDFFGTLGVKLTLGRDFTSDEDLSGGPPVVIISDRLWKDRFGGNPDILGKSVTLDGVGRVVIGVVPAGFSFPDDSNDPDVYTPLGQSFQANLNDRVTRPGIRAIARLKPELGLAQGLADLSTVQDQMNQLYPNADRGLEPYTVPLKQAIVGDIGGTLLLLLGAVGLVLLIACGNVANLLLARSASRSQEFAIRMALGASRAQIVRQLITESLLLSFLGGVLGLAFAEWGIRPVVAMVAQNLPRSGNINVNGRVLLFTFGVSIAVGILFGLAPALKSSNPDLQSGLKEGGRGYARANHRTQRFLVIGQIALTLVLLTGGSLLFRTVRNLLMVDPGLKAQHSITFKVGVSAELTKTPDSTRIAYQQLIDRISGIPGVQAADVTTLLPLSRQKGSFPFWVGSQQPSTLSEAPRVLTFSTGPDYLKATGTPLIQGRWFTLEETEPVIVIDTVLAHTFFPNEDPVGKIITLVYLGPFRVIGVVGHIQHWGVDGNNQGTQPQAYSSIYQIPDPWVSAMYVDSAMIIRTPLSPAEVMPLIRNAVYGASSDQPVYDVRTMEDFISESITTQRFSMILLGAFAVLALLLASIGIYGVISYSMAEREKEIGIRMALGAEKHDVLNMVVGQGLKLALVGTATGIVAALIFTRFLSGFSRLLSGVSANDPLSFAVVSLVLITVTLLACYIPARRAANVDPITAIRAE